MNGRAAVGLFAKPALPGRVKTRLSPPLTPEQCALLYDAFLADTAAMLASDPAWDWIVYSTDPETQAAGWPGDAPRPLAFRTQRGEDLGARMHRALEEMLEGDGYGKALLIGSDHPTLPAAMVREAFLHLDRSAVVIGPSVDGGYYLVGLREPRTDLFAGVAWSTSGVLEATLSRLGEAGAPTALLPSWYDVDTPRDLDFLRLHLAALALEYPTDPPCPRTRRILEAIPSAPPDLPTTF